jgi:capsular polysaccharide biosynthesis protein
MLAHLSLSVPPKATYRSRPKYTATELVLVNSAVNPVVRTTVSGSIRPIRGQKSAGKRSQTTTTVSPAVVAQPAPPQADINTLVYAANFYPHLITSDPVLVLRRHMVGELRGTVVAKAINSVQTAIGKYKPGNVPIIQVDATAARPDKAITLAKTTVTAFASWLTRSQNKSQVPLNQRIVITALDVPDKAVSSGGPKKGLAILVAFAILAAFAGIAILLDKIPSRETADEILPRPVLDSGTTPNGSDRSTDVATTIRKQGLGPQVHAAAKTEADITPADELGPVLTEELVRSRRTEGKGTENARSDHRAEL